MFTIIRRLFIVLLLILFALSLDVQILRIDSLKAVNLEEDKGPFATMNDEILFITAVLDLANDSILFWQHSAIHEFSDSLNTLVLEHFTTPTLDSTHYLMMALIELDDLQSDSSINQAFKSLFLSYAAHPYNLLKENIRTGLGDNDLLGFLYLKQKNLGKIGASVSFKGMHMFNRYEYEIYLSHP